MLLYLVKIRQYHVITVNLSQIIIAIVGNRNRQFLKLQLVQWENIR